MFANNLSAFSLRPLMDELDPGILWMLFGMLARPAAWRDFFPVADANTHVSVI